MSKGNRGKTNLFTFLVLLCLLGIKVAYMRHGTLPQKSVMSERKKLLKDVCKKTKPPTNRAAWPSYVVDHEKKLVYGWVPKVMSSSMFYIMVYCKPAFRKFHPNLTFSVENASTFYGIEGRDKQNYKHRQHGVALDKFGLTSSSPQRLEQLEDYFIFAIVRDPFARLASAFNELSKHGYGKVYAMWINQVEDIRNVLKLEDTSKKISFQEFLDYIIIDPKNQATNKTVGHWASYEEFLDPCLVRFDYIAKMEEITTELHPIMQKICEQNATAVLKMASNKSKKYNTDCYYKSVSQRTINGIVEKYRNDFLLFGYDMHRYSQVSLLSNISCSQNSSYY